MSNYVIYFLNFKWYYWIVFLIGAQVKTTKTELKGQRKCWTIRIRIAECPDKAIDLFLKYVKVYEDKIEIGLNYSLNQNDAAYVPIKNYAFTETLEITRTFKGGTTKTKTLTYDVYSVI